MSKFTTNQLRHVAMLSHSGAGKTYLGEAFLFIAKWLVVELQQGEA